MTAPARFRCFVRTPRCPSEPASQSRAHRPSVLKCVISSSSSSPLRSEMILLHFHHRVARNQTEQMAIGPFQILGILRLQRQLHPIFGIPDFGYEPSISRGYIAIVALRCSASELSALLV